MSRYGPVSGRAGDRARNRSPGMPRTRQGARSVSAERPRPPHPRPAAPGASGTDRRPRFRPRDRRRPRLPRHGQPGRVLPELPRQVRPGRAGLRRGDGRDDRRRPRRHPVARQALRRLPGPRRRLPPAVRRAPRPQGKPLVRRPDAEGTRRDVQRAPSRPRRRRARPQRHLRDVRPVHPLVARARPAVPASGNRRAVRAPHPRGHPGRGR